MELEVNRDIHKGDDINQLTTSLIKSFFYNNSRLINAVNEEIEICKQNGDLYSKSIELKDGVIDVGNGAFSIYGYCLGTYIQFSGHFHNKDYYNIKINNIPPFFGYIDIDFFTLDAYVQIIESENKNVEVKFNSSHSLNYIQGSKELFIKWLNKALDKRFPMTKIKNPISRFLY